MRFVAALLLPFALLACSPPGAARGNQLACDINYTLTVGPVLMESRANVAITLDPLARRWRVTRLEITQPWQGPEGINPWAIFPEGRDLELARVREDGVTLFESDAGAFTINRVTGDAGWAREGPAGESEYSGGCQG